MTVLVTGGAGYLGSHMTVKLVNNGYEVIIVDNFCNSSEKIIPRINELASKEITVINQDLCDSSGVDKIFHDYDIDAVIHFAALKSAPRSVVEPLDYFYNNFTSTLNVLNAMKKYNVNKFVFSSSATVYGNPKKVPITEDMPLAAVNPYGRTKLVIEDMLRDIHNADDNMNIAILRYFNVVGTHPSGRIGENPKGIPANIMPYISQVAVGHIDILPITGTDYPTRDGTGIRDYIHVEDLIEGHIAALRWMDTNSGLLTVNLGTGKGYTVKEVVYAYEKASGKTIPTEEVARRPGDIAECYADVALAKELLGFEATRDLDDMCKDSWNWQSNNPNGYL